ncbi:hypothetical protein [Streptomyces salyersiae]|uniref:Uncharacterized protein n=1 Tax=Streptomyces salyersiae TaxID=3075530 RepID=A0ABU2REJ6_9ACTN|nr:hypothetical protein [Streptomyces sp. DSM 41770]MDT0426349.1 hypothetical protein [Streptomyces sp. DSM 41770]
MAQAPDPQPEEADREADPVTEAAVGEQRRAELLAKVREANKWSAGRPV